MGVHTEEIRAQLEAESQEQLAIYQARLEEEKALRLVERLEVKRDELEGVIANASGALAEINSELDSLSEDEEVTDEDGEEVPNEEIG